MMDLLLSPSQMKKNNALVVVTVHHVAQLVILYRRYGTHVDRLPRDRLFCLLHSLTRRSFNSICRLQHVSQDPSTNTCAHINVTE